MKTLVAYFSEEGNTKVLANTISDVVKGDIFEIAPTEKYTSADLNWQDKSSRSSVEMQDKASRPTIADKVENMEQYDTVFGGSGMGKTDSILQKSCSASTKWVNGKVLRPHADSKTVENWINSLNL